MIVTQSDARKIIAKHHPDIKVRLARTLTVVSLPIWEHRAGALALCWHKLDASPGSAVRIGRMDANFQPDWSWEG